MATVKMEASPSTVQWGFLDGNRDPVSYVNPGDTLYVRSVSGSLKHSFPEEVIPLALRNIFEQVQEQGPGPHILTGPAWVKGAFPGDTLVVDIQSINIWVPYGFNYSIPLKGLFPYGVNKPNELFIPFSEDGNFAQIGERIKIPLKPFFGILAVAPPASWGKVSSVPPGRYGGNLDNRELTNGSRLFLPVLQEGALFTVGDGHGAKGDGEINVTAIETCLEGEFLLSVQKHTGQQWPYAMKGNYLISMGFDEDLDMALKACAGQMIQLLQSNYNFFYTEAYRLCSLAVSFRITQAVNGFKGVHGLLDLRVISVTSETLLNKQREESRACSPKQIMNG